MTRRRPAGGLMRTIVGAAAVLAAYYSVPLHPDRDLGVRIALTVGCLAVLATVITRHVRRGDDPVGRLSLVLVVAVATLALSFAAVAATPGQFVGLETRTDALYFTVVTMATIGYGDIHPVGQLARGLVVVAVAFDLVFLTLLGSTIVDRLRGRAAEAPR